MFITMVYPTLRFLYGMPTILGRCVPALFGLLPACLATQIVT